MLRSCLVLLAAYAALFFLYQRWLAQELDSPERYIGAGIMALVAGGSLGALYNAWTAYREWSLLAGARHGLPWSDGRWTAVAGEIHPVAEPVLTPFTEQECVLCEYEVNLSTNRPRNDDNNQAPGADFAGFLMNPCVVRSMFGELRLLGFPHLFRVGWKHHQDSAALTKAKEFLLGTEFEDLSGVRLLNVFSAIKSAWMDDDGLLRKNLRLTSKSPQEIYAANNRSDLTAGNEDEDLPDEEFDADEEDDDDEWKDPEEFAEAVDRYESKDDNLTWATSGMLLREKRVKVGEKVCAFGIYRAEKRGLVPGGLGADKFIKLVRGNITTIEQESRSSFFRYLLGGLIGFVLVHLAGYGVILAAAAQK
jgi:hypothetical protein